MPKKQKSQLFTYAELVKNNKDIFSKQYTRGWRENDSHYICKVFLGEQIRRHYPSNYMQVIYEYSGMPPLGTADNPRTYVPDVFCFLRHHGDNKIYISDIEIDGKIHEASRHQINKSKWRRESITDYFTNYIDKTYHNYPIVFSYLVFTPEDFLYNKLGFFMGIFNDKFKKGGRYPESDSYEDNFL